MLLARISGSSCSRECMSPDGTLYDLTGLSATAYSWRRGFRIILAVGTVAFVALLLLILVVNLYRGTIVQNLSVTYGAAYIALGAGVVIGGRGIWVLGPGATALTIAPDAITFHYRSGRKDRLGWSSPRFRLNLWDWSSSASFLPPAALYEASIRNRPRTQLTGIVFQAIVEAARSHGLTVSSKGASAARYGSSGQVVLIRSRAA